MATRKNHVQPRHHLAPSLRLPENRLPPNLRWRDAGTVSADCEFNEPEPRAPLDEKVALRGDLNFQSNLSSFEVSPDAIHLSDTLRDLMQSNKTYSLYGTLHQNEIFLDLERFERHYRLMHGIPEVSEPSTEPRRGRGLHARLFTYPGRDWGVRTSCWGEWARAGLSVTWGDWKPCISCTTQERDTALGGMPRVIASLSLSSVEIGFYALTIGADLSVVVFFIVMLTLHCVGLWPNTC